jgi:galactose mutarotase-like enzyme
VWNRHAPILFPIVGRLRNNQYQWDGQSFSLSQHGFARDREFDYLDRSENSLTLALYADVETRRVYPFNFELRVTYTVADNSLEITYQVINRGEERMLFSIGAHPGFNCPLLPNETFEDYYLEFAQPETMERHLLEDGLFNGQTEPFLYRQQTLPLSRSLFEQDAVVVKNFKSQSLILKSNQHAHQVKVSFAGFPYLGIWTKNAASPFLCIEPWYGLADRTDASGNLADKEGIISLKAGEQFRCRHTIEVS